MRTSLNEIKEAEAFIFNRLRDDETVLFRARLILEPVLKLNVLAQKKIYALVKMYGRQEIKSEIQVIHARIFNDPANAGFRNQIERLFLKP